MNQSTGPQPGRYRPYVAARAPEGRPDQAPQWRLLVHRKHQQMWRDLADRCGLQNAQQAWDHLTQQPDRPPKLGTVTAMKGKHFAAKPDGTSGVYHYEITGAGRIDYRFNRTYRVSPGSDAHAVVFIISIDLGSH
ncbi:hypothetical protein ACFVWG_14425 [Kribbella sp. NPDC058245]|uniref:hypothetical protein n=1 Tax=Kribbella sp. NPDC058245 TaxID=3346399 RepID=UPI0036E0EF8F